MENKKTWVAVLLVISVAILITGSFLLLQYLYQMNEAQKDIDRLKRIKNGEQSHQEGDVMSPGFRALKQQNPDFAGWIRIEGTRIDYPVMQSEGEFYLDHDFDQNSSAAGLPFVDERCDLTATSVNTIIYGHNLKNGDMFADLLKLQNKGNGEIMPYIEFDTIRQRGRYGIVAMFWVPLPNGYDYWIYDFLKTDDEESVRQLQQIMQEYSLYQPEIPVEVEAGDELITLSTCSKRSYDGRFVVIGKREKG